jgi:hypothetical protein
MINLPDAWFGLKPPSPASVQAAYGCRARLLGQGTEQRINVVWNRQQTFPRPTPRAFSDWIEGQLQMWLCMKCGNTSIPRSNETFTLDDGPFHAIACPKLSFGYLYVGAWMDDA